MFGDEIDTNHNNMVDMSMLSMESKDDDNINCRLTGTPHPDPTLKTGPWDYRERLMFFQRIFPTNVVGDPDSPSARLKTMG